jgi:microsomal dipeptidase-like Zn-dependent dipeptidase
VAKTILKGLAVAALLGIAFVHWFLPALIEGSMNVVVPHEPYQVRPEVAEFHKTLFVADLHADSLLWKRDLLKRSDVGQIDLPRLQEGNVALQVFSATTKTPAGLNIEENTADSDNITMLAVAQFWPVATWGSIYERARYQLQKLWDFAEDSNGELIVLQSKSDLRSLVERRESGDNVTGGLYLIEGAHPLEGEVENLDKLFAQGLRMSGLTHFFDNELGGSLHGVSGEGLTQFGKQVIKRAGELGIIIDIAHASPAMVRDVLSMSDRPVILSHGGIKGACDTSRNLDDELMLEIANRGGIIGIGYWESAVCDPSPTGIVRSIRYGIDLMGADHVALGSDYDGAVTTTLDSSELAILTQTMMDEEFSEEEIRKVMGENVKRFLLENLPD